MKSQKQNHSSSPLPRRRFLSLSGVLLISPGLLPWSSSKNPQLTFKMKSGKKEIGIKISEDATGSLLFTAREMQGGKLLVLPLGPPKGQTAKATYAKQFKTKNGSMFRLSLHSTGKITSDVRSIRFSDSRYEPGRGGASSQGFFSWLGNLVRDVATGIAAVFTWLTGNAAVLGLSGGGTIIVSPSEISYQPGDGFMLEPGMEERPNIWY